MIEKLLSLKGISIPPNSEWNIAFRNIPALWIIILLIIPFTVIYFWLIYRREKIRGRKFVRYILYFLRLLVFFLLLTVVFQPYIVVTTYKLIRSNFLLLFDNSRSMSIVDKYVDYEVRKNLAQALTSKEKQITPEKINNLSRLDLVKLLWEKNREKLLGSLSERVDLQLYSFSEELRKISGDSVQQLAPVGRCTALGNAIRQAIYEQKGATISGIAIFTDGASNAGEDPKILVQELSGLPRIPAIYAFGVGNSEEPKDIELTKLTAPELTVIGDSVEFDFIVKSNGFDGQSITIGLYEDGLSVADKTITLIGKGQEQRVTIQYEPKKEGKHSIKIEAAVQPDEINEKNNQLLHTLEVLSSRLRILYLEKSPRWEYRYLKNYLIRDNKNFKVQVWLFDAQVGFTQESSIDTPPLEEPPYDRKKLFNDYDIIIIGDVAPEDFESISYSSSKDVTMGNIVKFVKDFGGGILFIAGESFMPGRYKGTPLEEILPIILTDQQISSVAEQYYTKEHTFKLTPEGKDSPIFKLTKDEEFNKKLLGYDSESEKEVTPLLSGFYWFYRVSRNKPSAVVLANIVTDEQAEYPLVMTMNAGYGRVVFVATDEIWRWRYLSGDRFYTPFWSQIFSYLRGGQLRKNKRFFLFVDKPVYGVNERVKLSARAFDINFELMTNPTFNVVIQKPDNNRSDLKLQMLPQQKGNYEGFYLPDLQGDYVASVSQEYLEDPSSSVQVTFKVETKDIELINPKQNLELLNFISEKTGGTYLKLWEIDKLLESIKKRTQELNYKTQVTECDLWDWHVAIVLLLVILSVEWILRKRVQLL